MCICVLRVNMYDLQISEESEGNRDCEKNVGSTLSGGLGGRGGGGPALTEFQLWSFKFFFFFSFGLWYLYTGYMNMDLKIGCFEARRFFCVCQGKKRDVKLN